VVRSSTKPEVAACSGDALVGEIAHDITNALMPILSFTELLLAHPEHLEDREMTSRFLTAIRVSAEDAARVVRRLQELCGVPERNETFATVGPNDVARGAAR